MQPAGHSEAPAFPGGTISEWCDHRHFSRSLFYKLPDEDKPVVIRLGEKPLITTEADQDWWERMKAKFGPNSEEAAA